MQKVAKILRSFSLVHYQATSEWRKMLRYRPVTPMTCNGKYANNLGTQCGQNTSILNVNQEN